MNHPVHPVLATPTEATARGAKPARPLPGGFEPMLSLNDLASLLSCSRRLVERMRSAGRVPKPDMHVGRCPRWKPATVRRWIDEGGGR